MVCISVISGRFGDWEIRASERGVTAVTNELSHVPVPENEYSRQGAEELWQYLAGTRTVFSVPLDLTGTSFQCSVWEKLLEIPYGAWSSYGQVAERLGKPSSVRAVARAIRNNPCLVLVPCHRVLGKHGHLTGYSAGLELKKALLELEGIPYRI